MVSRTLYCAVTLLFAALAGPAEASIFMKRIRGAGEGAVEIISSELQSSILQEIEEMLGTEHQNTDSRLAHIEEALHTTFMSMPKNEEGKLNHAAVRYTLHSYFVQRHGWYVRGLADLGDTPSDSAPQGLLQDRVEEFVQGVFEERLGAHGLSLRELASLAATFENLVKKESMVRLNGTLDILQRSRTADMDVHQVDQVLDTYMMGYVMGLNYTNLSPRHLAKLKAGVYEVYPSWEETRHFLRELREESSFHKHHYSRADVEKLLEVVGDRYGRWQDRECQNQKSRLLALEDRSIGTNGSGRVRLADFYGSALTAGNWEFSESTEYLTNLGVLDLHDANILRVVIPNYINSPSNCIASSKFYSVCCINECEDLMDRVEHHFAAPAAAPQELAAFVASLPSSSVAAGRILHPVLLARLDDIARHHDGRVPLHGRLFAQWLHHAYPRECPYPHVAGTTQPQTPGDYYIAHPNEPNERQLPTLSTEAMQRMVDEANVKAAASEGSVRDECTEWSHHEELYVGSPYANAVLTMSSGGALPSSLASWVRAVAYLTLAMAGTLALVQRLMSSDGERRTRITSGGFVTSRGKDLFL